MIAQAMVRACSPVYPQRLHRIEQPQRFEPGEALPVAMGSAGGFTPSVGQPSGKRAGNFRCSQRAKCRTVA